MLFQCRVALRTFPFVREFERSRQQKKKRKKTDGIPLSDVHRAETESIRKFTNRKITLPYNHPCQVSYLVINGTKRNKYDSMEILARISIIAPDTFLKLLADLLILSMRDYSLGKQIINSYAKVSRLRGIVATRNPRSTVLFHLEKFMDFSYASIYKKC